MTSLDTIGKALCAVSLWVFRVTQWCHRWAAALQYLHRRTPPLQLIPKAGGCRRQRVANTASISQLLSHFPSLLSRLVCRWSALLLTLHVVRAQHVHSVLIRALILLAVERPLANDHTDLGGVGIHLCERRLRGRRYCRRCAGVGRQVLRAAAGRAQKAVRQRLHAGRHLPRQPAVLQEVVGGAEQVAVVIIEVQQACAGVQHAGVAVHVHGLHVFCCCVAVHGEAGCGLLGTGGGLGHLGGSGGGILGAALVADLLDEAVQRLLVLHRGHAELAVVLH
mmetsp:Transcript_11418/g.28797  ORF Transcript_11418/g.28797 Transcript_11418/m.28797 type:complete len:279 (-) Transcript_11418:113-949(-)